MPDNAVYVGRPSLYGNPFPVDIYGRERAVDLFRRWLDGYLSADELGDLSTYPEIHMGAARRVLLSAIPFLRGKSLACWCPDGPCHADVLLKLANTP